MRAASANEVMRISVQVCVCEYVCVCVRGREGQTESDRQERQREAERTQGNRGGEEEGVMTMKTRLTNGIKTDV